MIKRADIKHLTEYATPEESPGYLLWRVSTQWRSSIEDVLKPLDLTHPQFVVLAATGWLTQKGEHVRQVDIGRMAGLDPNTTSQILRGLEAKNCIKRIQSIDERSKSPMLTAKGSEKLALALPAVEKADTEFFNVLQVKEMKSLLGFFQKLVLE